MKFQMIVSVFVFVLILPFIETQYSSKCNVPVLKSWIVHQNFIDYRFPGDSVSVVKKTDNLLAISDRVRIPFSDDFGSLWNITKLNNFIEIEFTSPIIISSFAITSCIQNSGNCIVTEPNRDSTFTIDYKSRSNDYFNRLKPVHFPNGNIIIESGQDGLPTEVSIKPIQAESVRVTKKYSVSDTTNTEYLMQIEIYGCSKLPENIVSLNPNIMHYAMKPSNTKPSRDTLIEGRCTKYGCDGMKGTLIDGIIIINSSLMAQNTLTWTSKGSDGQNIFIKLFFTGDFLVKYLVIHSIYDANGRSWTPEVYISGIKCNKISDPVLSGTSHALYELNVNTTNQLIIELRVQHDISLALSEIEVFGVKKATQNNTNSFDLGQPNIQLFVSSVYFTISLALIIPLFVSVVVICFRIKRQAEYFPIQQNTKNSNSTNLFSSKEILRYNDQSYNSNSRITSLDTTQQTVPLTNDSIIKRLDTSALDNLYERIPTLTGGNQSELRASFKKPPKLSNPNKEVGTETNIHPLYSVPVKNNKPVSHGGYLELRNVSVDGRTPTLATPQDDDPLYDYVRPRSAILQLEEGSQPAHQYLNTQRFPNYFNTSIKTSL